MSIEGFKTHMCNEHGTTRSMLEYILAQDPEDCIEVHVRDHHFWKKWDKDTLKNNRICDHTHEGLKD